METEKVVQVAQAKALEISKNFLLKDAAHDDRAPLCNIAERQEWKSVPGGTRLVR